MSFPFFISKPLGDNTITLVGEYYDDGSTDLQDIQIDGESISELIGAICNMAQRAPHGKAYGAIWRHFEQMAADEYGSYQEQERMAVAESRWEARRDEAMVKEWEKV